MEFAFENRRLISERVKESFISTIDCQFEEDLDINHNYAAYENHFGQNLIIHRKGATRARNGEIGIIPGSMGTASYIVEGLGNRDSFNSCSHGAGRRMGRNDASNILTVEECDEAMDCIIFDGWGTNRKGQTDLGEAPQAYKDIEDVIESELDLIKPLVKLKPLAVVKG
jgi:tRNA-splicing ligase RtcB